jgi:hypothetical protein
MRLNEYFDKLKKEQLKSKEYNSLKTQCLRLVRKACRRYHIDDILYNNVIKNEVVHNIYTKSLMKTLKGHDGKRGSFSTYFYYKALSAARVEVGKLKRRMRVENTSSLDETYYKEKD